MFHFRILPFLIAAIGSTEAACGGELTINNTVTDVLIESPGYPIEYPNNEKCEWIITGPEGHGLMITAVDFELENHATCSYDSLQVFEGTATDGPSAGKFCGTIGPNRARVSNNKARIVFSSDATTGRKGFQIRVQKQKCALTELLCPNAGIEDFCFKLDQFCDGTTPSQCPNGADQHCPRGCGIPATKPLLSTRNARIMGGIEAKAHSWPWQIALLTKSTGALTCGGTIIDHYWVITAARCCDPNDLKKVVRVGEHTLSGTVEQNAWTYEIEKMVVHPQYKPLSAVRSHDICLIKTISPIFFNNDVLPVCLGSGELPAVGTDCYVTGFGNVATTGTPSNVLRQVDVKITDNKACQRAYDGAISEDMVCAYNLGKDICQKDDGGPLVCPSRSDPNSFELVGVASWHRGCADAGYPGVYAKTSYFIDWISEIISSE